jgi:hypothetical protein
MRENRWKRKRKRKMMMKRGRLEKGKENKTMIAN